MDCKHVYSGFQWKNTIVKYSTTPNTTKIIDIIV